MLTYSSGTLPTDRRFTGRRWEQGKWIVQMRPVVRPIGSLGGSPSFCIPAHDWSDCAICLLRSNVRVIFLALILVLLTGCHFSHSNSDYVRAREVLDAEVTALPLPPGSQTLARYDGVSTGRVEACRGVVTELLVGNILPSSDVYQFYKDRLVARGWKVTLDITLDEAPGVTLEKDGRYGIEVSDNYYVSTGIPRDTIKSGEARFESLIFIGIGYGVYDPEKCQQAIDKLDRP